ncbi:hypothetical protein CYMTET_29514 [Cymbomonas tetramitiformis]|uniref:Uncharacterized protein n=1 Tax=Cymbomonas tetramitiformis TaxID=36881 RepID=A0AAE0FKP1_9CHLO|nr:hypothetical protein CYMTET_29514 [Cymbomonas tetramitiformis]
MPANYHQLSQAVYRVAKLTEAQGFELLDPNAQSSCTFSLAAQAVRTRTDVAWASPMNVMVVNFVSDTGEDDGTPASEPDERDGRQFVSDTGEDDGKPAPQSPESPSSAAGVEIRWTDAAKIFNEGASNAQIPTCSPTLPPKSNVSHELEHHQSPVHETKALEERMMNIETQMSTISSQLLHITRLLQENG